MKTERQTGSPPPGPGAGASHPMWWRLYFVLAAFDLVTISFSLYLNHRLIGIHDESARINQEWAERRSIFADLAQLGGEVNAPGNDVFDSRDVTAETARLGVALDRFNRELSAAAVDLLRDVAPRHKKVLREDLDRVGKAMKEMVAEAELIFSCFRRKQPELAGERMATMDRKYALLNGGFAQLNRHIRGIQEDAFRDQKAEANALRRYEYLIAGAILIMVLAVTIYGHRMGRTMTAVMEEKERYLVALRAGHENLAEQTREQSARLHALLAATKSIAQDQLNTRVPVESRDEIGLVAESFNLMAAELEKSEANNQAQLAGIQRMVEATRESKNFLHSLVESLPLYLFRKDTEGRYTFMNALACERMNKSLEDILGRTDADLAEPSLAARWQEPQANVLREGVTVERDEVFKGEDGITLHFHVILSPVFNQDGTVLGMQGIVFDITARKQVEQALASTQDRLVDASRQAGMAEVASSVLHNVGNVLTSVNVSAGLIGEQLRKSGTTHLAKAVQLLNAHKEDMGDFLTNDPKGRQLPAFLEAVTEQLTREQALLARETQSLQQNIEHIKQIVAMQQSYAKVSGERENLAPHELVEDALRMSSTGLASDQLEVVRQFEPVPPVLADRHGVLQILVNLISNAVQALEARPEGRRLTLRTAQSADGRVRVEVTDNGTGIASENLTRIFQHGFTTKKNGHGFGLHSGANAAKAMGGSLQVHSNGPGTGATFVLELPPSRSGTQPVAPRAGELPTQASRAA